jgi:hypothetical protein
MNSETENQLVASDRPSLNESAINEYALLCSKLYRAGKFTRVGKDFRDEVYTDVECIIRKLRSEYRETLHAPVEIPESGFVKGAVLDKIRTELNATIGRCIQNKVQKQPTVGCTLGRTR